MIYTATKNNNNNKNKNNNNNNCLWFYIGEKQSVPIALSSWTTRRCGHSNFTSVFNFLHNNNKISSDIMRSVLDVTKIESQLITTILPAVHCKKNSPSRRNIVTEASVV